MGIFSKCRCPELEAKQEALEKRFRTLKQEMEETSDKVYRWMKRTQMRDRIDAAPIDADNGGETDAPSPVIARILTRRRTRGVPTRLSSEG